ncbi:cell wall hydrolase [Henriciella aquimarina]|uniref:cell wall hydrolase n=1 Tax=Henriciella aquimarina TaxID=545261 RepID=UPI0009FCBDD8|nr:cell wall hydrolase [Henriciella aquimarina]
MALKKTTQRPRVFADTSLRGKISRWWLAKSNAEQRAYVARGGLAAVCALGLTVALPVISSINLEKRAEAEYRAQTQRFAEAQDAGEAVRADPLAPSLMSHAWIRNVEYSLERDPESATSRYGGLERDAAVLAGMKSFEPTHLVKAEDMDRQMQCVAEAVYYEARSETTSGQLAVAEVIMNRIKDHRYPNSACGVVYQGATRTTGCQFTFTCDGALGRKPHGIRWDRAKTIAAHVMLNLEEPRTGGATHYHATYVNPVWNAGLIKTSKIGTHIFYRFPRGAEWASARAAQRARIANKADGNGADSTMVTLTTPDTEDLNSRSLNVLSPAP